ncbi:hypothetical protein KTO58_25690 [Chitinophaga pendula]|uniref:hypothetical protein n=1 Tax=Chitinophaga TaxID=79328 RepID=UPI0012FD637D|nr:MULTISPECIES: hypothetical protein [Chitinophaga]UCJ07019.1 hypothetical protein KTO58_25690 [Chitinophaga pendula]
MKKLVALLLLCTILGTACATQEKGCSANNFYTKDIKKQNRKSSRQMNGRVF